MPKKIGKYELGKTLGTGTFSKVKLGIDTESPDQRQFAIKIIDKAQLAKEHMEEQLKREIAVMKLLKHPNIVGLEEVLQTAKHIYLILELITGGELFDKIVEAKKFDEKTARFYFQQMILGLYYCHDQGIAHRDLKPENLLLAGDGTLKISDFGLSNLQRGGAGQGGTLLQTVCGTPNYVAPEVLKERGYNGITADIWSCGVILFVMLAGYLPFEDANMNALFNKIERGEYRMPQKFSAETQDLIRQMLVIDPEKRATLDQVIAHQWFQIDFDPERLKQSKGRRLRVGHDVPAVEHVAEPTDSSPRTGAASPQGRSAGPQEALLFSATRQLIEVAKQAAAKPDEKIEKLLDLVPKTYGRFAVSVGISDASSKVEGVLNELKANPKIKKTGAGENPEIKGFINATKGLLTYIATLRCVLDDLTFVEIKRGRGDPADFEGFIKSVIQGVGKSGDLCSKQP